MVYAMYAITFVGNIKIALGYRRFYVEVEKALKQGHHPLAHWIVASSLNQRAGAPYDAFAANFDQIKIIFATRNI
ncbi:hypothetical protein DL98DRAFT_594332 [Cadophora sp. DSE1049]|nr:hypothetical protein DL98DRAFT_594332 [Cadophora sp. DSE1049]